VIEKIKSIVGFNMLNTIGQPNGEIKDVPNEWRNLNWKTIDRYVFKRVFEKLAQG